VNFNAFLDAATQGNIESMNRLGIRCQSGKGCEKDLAQAKYWLQKARNLGFALADSELADLES